MESSDYPFRVKVGLAEMLKGGVIMDVTNAEQAKIAEDAGAAAVMALERVPADIRAEGRRRAHGVDRQDRGDQRTVSIPVMAKCRIGHIAEARMLEALEVDFIDESEVLTPADEENHVWKHDFKVPFVCGCRNLGEALRRIGEGAAMIRTKGEAGSGTSSRRCVTCARCAAICSRLTIARRGRADGRGEGAAGALELVRWVARERHAAGAELRRRRRRDPGRRGAVHDARRRVGVRRLGHLQVRRTRRAAAKAIVQAVTHWQDPGVLLEVSRGLERGHAGSRHRQAHPRGDALAPGVVACGSAFSRSRATWRGPRRGAPPAGRGGGRRSGRPPTSTASPPSFCRAASRPPCCG